MWGKLIIYRPIFCLRPTAGYKIMSFMISNDEGCVI